MNRSEVCWVPTNANNFLLVQNNDLVLYKLEALNLSNSKRTASGPVVNSLSSQVSDDWLATILSKNVDNTFLKCFDQHPSPEHEHLVAAGHANGRVLVTSPCASLPDVWMGREFLPKHSRACLSLAWNPRSQNLLAIGLDRYRADNSIHVWDLNSRPIFVDSASAAIMSTSGSGGVSSAAIANEHLFNLGPNSNAVLGADSRKSVAAQVESGKDAVLTATGAVGGMLYHSRASFEAAPSESVHSLTWFRQNSRVLLAGLSGKYIRLFDLRDSGRFLTSISTKAVNGISLDPFSDNRLCSHSDTQLLLWDMRYPDKPLLTIADQKPILKTQWDPIRRNVFSCLRKDSTVVHFYHLQQMIIAEENEISYIENCVQPLIGVSSDSLSSYALHPSEENRLLCVTQTGRINCATICDRLALDWNCQEKLLAAFPRCFTEINVLDLSRDQQQQAELNNTEEQEEDVSLLMKRRACSAYGLTDGANVFAHAADVCKLDANLRQVWTWMDRAKALYVEEADTWPYDTKFPGALTIMRAISGRGSSSVDYRSLLGDVTGHSLMTKFFTSLERDRILQICGWGSMMKEKLATTGGGDTFIQKLLNDKEFERAAAVALFTLRLKLAAQILTNASASADSFKHLQLVALALAGFPGMSESKDNAAYLAAVPITASHPCSFWLDLCQSVLANVANPYLKAAFQFLASKCNGSNSYDGILNMDEFPVNDKIAFAAVHLSDANFMEFLETLFGQCLNASNLVGLMICGFGNDDSMQLLESFIDETGDVQSVSLILLLSGSVRITDQPQQNGSNNVFPTAASDNNASLNNQFYKRSEEIVGCYLNLLNRWRFWHVRAETESLIIRSSSSDSSADKFGCTKIAPQVYLTCTFCSKSVWSSSGRTRQRLNKLGSCPCCKKPLPRCSLCRLHMGTPLGPDTGNKLNRFDLWFSWCQTCRHGGHAQHLTEWFQQHTECPVTGCTCKCGSLDVACG